MMETQPLTKTRNARSIKENHVFEEMSKKLPSAMKEKHGRTKERKKIDPQAPWFLGRFQVVA